MKNKYKLDPKTLSYEKVSNKHKISISHILWFLLSAIAFGFIFIIGLSHFFPSATEKQLKYELELLDKNYKQLDKKIKEAILIYNQLSEKDKEIYKLTFDTDKLTEELFEDFSHPSYDFNISTMLNLTSIQFDNIEVITTNYFTKLKILVDLAYNKQVYINSIPSLLPIQNDDFFIASGFGKRIHPFFKTLRMHNGVDMAARQGIPVYATANGRVIKPNTDFQQYGNVVVVQHEFDYITIYAHLLKTETRVGKRVEQGELIGYVGRSGMAAGPHLHYEVWHKNKPVNPLNFFFRSVNFQEYYKLQQKANVVNQSMS